MKTITLFSAGAIISMLLAAGLIYMSLGVLNLIVFLSIPLFIVLKLDNEKDKETLPVSGILSVLLSYFVMYSPWAWTSLATVTALIFLGFFRKPMKGLSFMAAWLTGFELAAIGMEWYAKHIYYMDNLWHDMAVVIFVTYTLTWDIRYNKKEVAY